MEHYKNLSLDDIEGEIWKNAFGYDGLYEVSSFGRIKSLDKCYGNLFFKSKIMKIRLDKDGYCVLNLSKLRKKSYTLVHRVVAIAFIPNPENKKFVNHKKGVKADNRVTELEWVTSSENSKHANSIGLSKSSLNLKHKLGKENHSSKSIYQLSLYGKIINEFHSVTLASEITKINRQNISRCCMGAIKTAGGYTWKHK